MATLTAPTPKPVTEQAPPTVFIVDDDDAVRSALGRLMRSADLPAETFPSAEAFLERDTIDRPGCLVVDLRMEGMSGLELQEELRRREIDIPVIVITAYGNVSAAVHAMKHEAIDFLEKPFDDSVLLKRIEEALQLDERRRREAASRGAQAQRLERLTPREREVAFLVVDGRISRQIAEQLHITQKTVEFHRAKIMRKLGASTVADLVRIVESVRSSSP